MVRMPGQHRHLVCETLRVEVDCVYIHLVAHPQEVPVCPLPLQHGQTVQVSIQLSIDPWGKSNGGREIAELGKMNVARVMDTLQTDG